MKLRIRVRVRTLMAIVAVVAFGFGLGFEWINHVSRDRLFQNMIKPYRYASSHLRRALECQQAEILGRPYPAARRYQELSSDRGLFPNLPGRPFESWFAERDYHTYWGERYFALTQDDRLRDIEAKLLLP